MAWSCPKDAQRQDTQYRLEMDPNWEEEKRLVKNHLAENNDQRAGGVGSNMGQSAGHSSGQSRVAKFNCGLMSQPGEEG